MCASRFCEMALNMGRHCECLWKGFCDRINEDWRLKGGSVLLMRRVDIGRASRNAGEDKRTDVRNERLEGVRNDGLMAREAMVSKVV